MNDPDHHMPRRVRNPIGWRHRLARWRGSPVDLYLGAFDAALDAIARLDGEIGQLDDEAFRARAASVRARVRRSVPAEAELAEWAALVREAGRRALGQRAFDEQVIAGIAMARGAVAEMQTGEGKTLAAVLPVSWHALAGAGAHVLTFNDYLAGRDAGWMGPVYRRLGLSVGCVRQGMARKDRRRAYAADVTYVTASEAGFDHLRDLLAREPGELTHRGFAFALVDEADSLMVDEARVPLVLAGRDDGPAEAGVDLATLVHALRAGVDYDTDEYRRNVELTEAGLDRVERALGRGPLHHADNLAVLTAVNCALHAHVLLRRDVDYIVRRGRIEIVDEFTGRVVEDRHWPDGLQAALEEKEGLRRRADGRILASMTVRRFLAGYQRLCGMTGTARDCAEELHAVHGLRVLVVPTHAPMIREDRPDLVFTHRAARDRAVVAEVGRAHAEGRPVLVGTLTIEQSEALAAALRADGVACRVLNARNDEEEAQVIAEAGAPGAVTISTNMAGRGTDIRLGGATERDRERVVALGGLYVIGTNRHESRRVDLQLRGRAGRQGDPGTSRFFVSLEDDLLVRFGFDTLVPSALRPARRDEPIDAPVIAREIARTQRIVEGQNLEIRKTLARYSAILEDQHGRVHEQRRALLLRDAEPDVWSRAPERHASLVARVGRVQVREAERAVTLGAIDRAWADHLAFCADVREGIHLVRLGGREPLERYTVAVVEAFNRFDEEVDEAVLRALESARVVDGTIDLASLGVTTPGATWTYLVNDDPFEHQMGALLTGSGRVVAVYAATVLTPLFLLWGTVSALVSRRRGRIPRGLKPPGSEE